MSADEPVAGVPRLCARRADCTRPRGHDDECGPDRADTELADLRAEVERLRGIALPVTDLAQELRLARENLRHSRAMSDAHFANLQREKARAESVEAERDALQRQVDAVVSVCSNTDGDLLDGESEIPVGEVLRMLVENGATVPALDAVEPADQPHPTPEADRCGASWNSNPVVSWSCGLPKGHEGAHLSLAAPERFQGPEHVRAGS